MSYTITVRVFQTNPSSGAYFRIVEQTTFRRTHDRIRGSGTSGALRFKSDKTNEPFIVRWCDIVTDPTPLQTAMAINEEYYGGGGRHGQRERQNAKGNSLVADVIVG
ncbi:Cytolysin/lectin [Mycena capillaripes]|nr:Cytolysin/lectin [Mycena capillaripes]